MVKLQHKVLAIAGVVAAVGMGWYVWPASQGPSARLITDSASVSYDAQARRLTVTVNIQNDGERQTEASVTNAVWIDSKKGALSDDGKPQPWRAELMSKQSSPVTFIVEGDTAAAVWDGVRLMEVTINANYEAHAKLNCSLSVVGRFYPLMKQIGTVSSFTSPSECRP